MKHTACLIMIAGLSACSTLPSGPILIEPVPMVPDAAMPPAIAVSDAAQGVGASWSSVMESPMAQTAAELSNLGGAPVVAGVVGLILAADAKPKARADRLSTALNAGLDGDALGDRLAARIDTALIDTALPDEGAETVLVDTVGELPDDAYLVQTDYALAEDASALRVVATVSHSDDIRRAVDVQRMIREYERRQQFSDGHTSLRDRRLVQRIRAAMAIPPRYRGRYEYHSRKVRLPEVGDPTDAAMEAAILSALDVERDARRAEAQTRHARAVADTESDRKRRRADRRLEKALEKADKAHAKSAERAQDGELDKMEQLLLGLVRWTEGDGAAEASDRLDTAIRKAHGFIAATLADRLSGEEVGGGDQQGRSVVALGYNSETGDEIISVPDEGTGDYGGSVARPDE